MKKLLLALLFLPLFLPAQVSLNAGGDPAVLPDLPPAFLSAFGGYDSGNGSKGFAGVGYAHKTGIDAGTGKPVYSYTEAVTYRVPGRTALQNFQATQITSGALYTFYDKKLASLRVTLAVAGDVGVSTTAQNVGFVLGAKVVARIAPVRSKWGLLVSADPNRTTAAGINATRVVGGLSYSFNGF